MNRNKSLGVVLLAGVLAAGCGGPDPTSAPASAEAQALDASSSSCLANLAAGRNVIPGRFIVSFRVDRVSPMVADHDAALTSALGARKSAVEIGVANAVAVSLSPAEVERLRADLRVAYVEPDGLACALDDAGTEDDVEGSGKPQPAPPPPPCATGDAETIPTGLAEINAPALQNTGAGVTVAVVDTGIDSAHPDLAGQVIGGTGFVDNTTGEDNEGHGTHVAGTIAAADNEIGVVGVAPGASLLAVKVLDSSGSGAYSDIAAGIDWAVANGADVINLSLGGSFDSATLHTAVLNARNAGVFVAVAAGNEGRNAARSYPAAYDDAVITVSAENPSTNGFPSWSNYGVPPVDIAAPGVNICSTTFDGLYGLKSGTSMATPHVAGAAALYLQSAAGTDPFAVRDAFVAGATPLADTRRHPEDLLNVAGL